MTNWRAEFESELSKAEQARARTNEGQARVCARRAAGIAIRAYLQHHDRLVKSSSAYALLKEIEVEVALPEQARAAAAALTLRVDEAFTLPVNVDLIAEARRLAEALLPDKA